MVTIHAAAQPCVFLVLFLRPTDGVQQVDRKAQDDVIDSCRALLVDDILGLKARDKFMHIHARIAAVEAGCVCGHRDAQLSSK